MPDVSRGDTPDDSAPPRSSAAGAPPLHERVRHWAYGIWVVGWLGAAALYLIAGDETQDAEAGAAGNHYEYAIARIGGQAAVYAARFDRWFSHLWHGRPLAWTVAALSLLVALSGLWVAGLMAEEPPIDDETARRRA